MNSFQLNQNHGIYEPDLIISVESRKGGVGKTTAALCLARLLRLRKDGFAVLFLDLDITGTNAADVADSPFWSGDLHSVSESGVIKDNDDKDSPVNLIAMFDQCLMTGKTIPQFSLTSDSTKKQLTVDLDKVNVLGSQIYGNGKDMKAACIEKPGVLFDDLHAFWLIDLVRQLIFDFTRTVRYDKKKTYSKTAIILDNSPGYVGFVPAIHDWLTDCGPERCKFLTVTSLDVQDILACDRAIDALHVLYSTKWETSRLFIKACQSGEDIEVDSDQETFFTRLAIAPQDKIMHTTIMNNLCFYKDQDEDIGKSFSEHPRKYSAFVINRVPRVVKTGRISFDPLFLNGKVSALHRLLSEKTSSRVWRDLMVPYDRYLENQFSLQLLKLSRLRPRGLSNQLLVTLKNIEHGLRKAIPDSSVNFMATTRHYLENLYGLQRSLDIANEAVLNARLSFRGTILEHIGDLVLDEWLPGSILIDFERALRKLLQQGHFPHDKTEPFVLDSGFLNEDDRVSANFLRDEILSGWKRTTQQHLQDDMDWNFPNEIVNIMACLIGLSLAPYLRQKSLVKNITDLFSWMLGIELEHWYKKENDWNKKYKVTRFLANDSISQKDLKKYRNSAPKQFYHFLSIEEGSITFIDFYDACTSAQARIIDYRADSLFLMQLLQFTVELMGKKRDRLFPYLKGIAQDVIENKTVSHEEAPSRFLKAVQSSEYFAEFDKVLRKVLAIWGIKV